MYDYVIIDDESTCTVATRREAKKILRDFARDWQGQLDENETYAEAVDRAYTCIVELTSAPTSSLRTALGESVGSVGGLAAIRRELAARA
jgi:hypothetical protein